MNQTEMDYYCILDIKRTATTEEIRLAYRRLAIMLCPNRDPKYEREFMSYPFEKEGTHLNPLSVKRQWEYINMAYDVLGDPLRKEIYDRYGEAGLFHGVMLPNGYFPPYQYHGDPMKVYEEVFGSTSAYANLIDAVSNPPVLFSEKAGGIGTRKRDPPVERFVAVELEEVRFGCTKLMHVMRQEFVDDKKENTEKRKKVLKLTLQPGVAPGTRYIFKEEGDRSTTTIPADIVFITCDKPHPVFERRNLHDLVYTKEVTLGDALGGFVFTITTLDRRQLKVAITDIIHPCYSKIIPGEGLPKCHRSSVKNTFSNSKGPASTDYELGDLIIEFKIRFPSAMTKDMRLQARKFFNSVYSMERCVKE